MFIYRWIIVSAVHLCGFNYSIFFPLGVQLKFTFTSPNLHKLTIGFLSPQATKPKIIPPYLHSVKSGTCYPQTTSSLFNGD
jgi:hypothetical protein